MHAPEHMRSAAADVVLYACIPPSNAAEPERVLQILREHAVRRGWTAVGEYVDRCSLGTTEHRPAWADVTEAVEAGRAQGILCPALAMIAYYPAQREQFKTWLAQTGAFAEYAMRTHRGAVPEGQVHA